MLKWGGAFRAFEHPGEGGAAAIVGAVGAAAAVVGAGAIGWTTATISANTIGGWSHSTDMLNSVMDRRDSPASFQGALHDSDWYEIDAESSAQDFVHNTLGVHPKYKQWKGVVPQPRSHPRDLVDWGLTAPFIAGVPAAAAVGTGVLATRLAFTWGRDVEHHGTPLNDVKDALALLRSGRRGPLNSYAIGGAVTIAPLMAGGIAGTLLSHAGIPPTMTKLASTGIAATASGALLTMLLAGRGAGFVSTSPKVVAGMIVGGALGLLSSSLAVGAAHPDQPVYDVSHGTSAAR
jgi:hypothetical protein